MGILANGGAHDGRTYISPGTTALLAEALVEGPDEVMLVNAPYGRGTTPFKNPLVRVCNTGSDPEFTVAGVGGITEPHGGGDNRKNPLVLVCNAGTDPEFTAVGWGLGNLTREEATLISPNEMVTGCCIKLLRASVMEPDCGGTQLRCDFAIDITAINTLSILIHQVSAWKWVPPLNWYEASALSQRWSWLSV